MNFVQYLSAVIALSTFITNANRHMFKNNHSFSMPEYLSLYNIFPHDTIAVFASIVANSFFVFRLHTL